MARWGDTEIMSGGWQPIETAPRDGREVDLWASRGFRYPDAAWDIVEYADQDQQDHHGWVDSNTHGSIEEFGPYTHWMPQPSPPEAQ